MRAFLLIRPEPQYRRDAFEAGLRACGYSIEGQPRGAVLPSDVLVIWNRYGRNHALASQFERAGARVVVAENGVLGREWRGDYWYALYLSAPAGGGFFPAGGPERWDGFGVDLCEWRNGGREIIVLAQRGIGPPGVAQPTNWHRSIAQQLAHRGPVRIREHPGERPCVSLHTDLAAARCVVTWASCAAIKALLWGIPVFHGYNKWLAADAAHHVQTLINPGPWPTDLPDRLATFRRLGWASWTTRELSTGLPFRRLLESPSTG